MANTVNLGSVVGPKPALRQIFRNKEIRGTEDTKGRLYIDSDPLVTGYKYLYLVSTSHSEDFRILLYAKNSDVVIGSLYVNHIESNFFHAMLPTPFNCSIDKNVATTVKLIEEGYTWS